MFPYMVVHLEHMQEFQEKIRLNKLFLTNELLSLKKEGKTIVGYGAPAKATTLLHYFGIGPDILDFIVDDSLLKVGRYMPGSHIPIVFSGEIYKTNPDCVFILAWNFAQPIIKKLRDNGYTGKVIVPFP